MVQKTRAKAVIAAILAGSDEPLSATQLHRAFFLSHLYYTRQGGTFLSNWPIVKGQHGPEIGQWRQLLAELREENRVRLEHRQIGPFTSALLQATGDVGELTNEEKSAIQKSVSFVEDYEPAQLDQVILNQSRCLRYADDGEELDVYLDLIPDDEFDAREQELAALSESLLAEFSTAKEAG